MQVSEAAKKATHGYARVRSDEKIEHMIERTIDEQLSKKGKPRGVGDVADEVILAEIVPKVI